jgi:putative acetyltransferase
MLQIKAITAEGKELDIIRRLFADYQSELNEDLCFQSFEDELRDPLKKYGPPKGALFLAYWNNEVAGCVALHDMGNAVCEMKRLYVKPPFRKNQVGRALAVLILDTAREKGFQTMKLDTLQKLQPAIKLYEQLGFHETTAYYENPINGVVYMEKEL